jgi:hypothetical protein
MAGVSTDLPTAGDRVELMRCDDPYTRLAPGTKGTVTLVSEPLRFFNNEEVVHVRWDDGSTLSLIRGVDSYRIIERVMD